MVDKIFWNKASKQWEAGFRLKTFVWFFEKVCGKLTSFVYVEEAWVLS